MMSELGRETIAGYAAAKGGLKMLTRNIASGTANTTSVQRHRPGLHRDAPDRTAAQRQADDRATRSVHRG